MYGCLGREFSFVWLVCLALSYIYSFETEFPGLKVTKVRDPCCVSFE